jgi:hypothetical protein
MLDKPIGQGRLPMVNMGNDRKISNVIKVTQAARSQNMDVEKLKPDPVCEVRRRRGIVAQWGSRRHEYAAPGWRGLSPWNRGVSP